MYKGQRFVRKFQHSSRQVVHSGHLALLHHLSNPFPTCRNGLNPSLKMNKVAAQAHSHQTSLWLDVQHARIHLNGWMQKEVCTLKLSHGIKISKHPFIISAVLNMPGLLYLKSLSVAGSLFWLHVEKIHLAIKRGQEVQDQAVFGHLQYKHTGFYMQFRGYISLVIVSCCFSSRTHIADNIKTPSLPP